MVHPVLVHDAQHDDALQLAHERRAVRHGAEGLLAPGVYVRGDGRERFVELFHRHAVAVNDLARPYKQTGERRDAFGQIVRVLRRDVADRLGDRVAHHALDILSDVLAVEHLAALLINKVALHVHHVVKLERALSRLEVAALDGLLRLLERAGEHFVLDGRVLIDAEALKHADEPLGAVKTHDVVRQRQEKPALAGVALTAASAAQLVIDTARLVPLGAEDVQSARGAHLFGLRARHGLVLGHLFAEERARFEDRFVLGFGVAGRLADRVLVVSGAAEIGLGQILRVAAEHDVRAAAGHVRGDRHGAELARLRDDLRFLLVVLGVEHAVRHALFAEHGRDVLALLDGDRADEHGLALGIARLDLLDDGAVLACLILVYNVVPVDADNGLVRRDLNDVERVDRLELLLLGERGAGHAGELSVQTEIVLERDRGKGLVLLLHVHVLFGFDGLVQTLGVPAAEHETAGELIDDDDLAVLDDVVDVAPHDAVRLERLVDVVRERGVFHVGEIFEIERRLRLGNAAGGERGGARLFIDDVVGVDIVGLLFLLVHGRDDELLQAGDEIVRAAVEVGGLVALTGDDERGARLVDEDGVHLVHDGECVAALHHVLFVERHVVAQIVKAHLVVRAVGDVRSVSGAALRAGETVDDETDAQSHEAVHLAHPFAVAPGEIVVHGDDMHALAGDGVQIRREHGDERFALAGLHFRNAPLMQHDAADELHAEGLHAQNAPARLAHGGKRLRQQVVQRLAALVARFEFLGLGAQSLVAQRSIFIAQRLDLIDRRKEPFYLPLAAGAEQFIKNTHGFAFPALRLSAEIVILILDYSTFRAEKKEEFRALRV